MSRFSPMEQQIIGAAMEIDGEEGYGYEPWNWSEAQFARIAALASGEAAVMRSASEWQRLIDEAYEAAAQGGNADLPGELEIAQRLLEQ